MQIRIVHVQRDEGIFKMLKSFKVDPYGVRIMAPKTIHYTLHITAIPCIAAQILKQEMLSCGGDVALPRASLTGRLRKTDGILIGTLSQINRLIEKLKMQPFGLKRLGQELSQTIVLYRRDKFDVKLRNRVLRLGARPCVMGIVNLTPDSFSGDGLYGKDVGRIVEYAVGLIRDGADILDIGGESSRPGAKPVSLKEELSRTIPVIKKLVKEIKKPISIDTSKPEVARQALDNGAEILNDITGLRYTGMRKIVAHYKAGCVIMHMKGTPKTMQKNPVYACLEDEILSYLKEAAQQARESGIAQESIIIDPGIGFGKTVQQNLQILRNLKEFKILGLPILVGTSRKSFIGKLLGAAPQERIMGSVASAVLAVSNGAHIVRAHDVKAVAQALKVTNAVLKLN